MEPQEFYSIPEAAKHCGVSRTTLWNWVKSGKVHSFVTPGGHHRILREDVSRLLEAGDPQPAKTTDLHSILVVDDDPFVLEMFKARLKGGRYRVETASDGFSAGLIMSRFQPDLVVLDLFMDNMDGFEVCRTIRNSAELKHARILALTGMDTPENRARILTEGADAYLAKTADFKTIKERIDSLLGLQKGSA